MIATTRTICAPTESDQAIRQALAHRLGPQKYNAWFRHGTQLELAEGGLRVGAANPFVAGWIESHFAQELALAAQEVLNHPVAISVGVDAALSEQLRSRQRDAQARLVTATAQGKATAAVCPTLRHRLEDFVTGSSNRLAYSAALAMTHADKGVCNRLFIHGSCGVGKTHLLQGVCAAVQASSPKARFKYITAEQFTNQFVEAIRAKRVESFRNSYRQLDLLAIDDVHFLAAKKATQEEFLHTFNAIDAAGRQVVMASDAHPSMVAQLAEQLVSRFMSGMVVKVQPPDPATRLAIMARWAQRANMQVEREVLEFVASAITGSVRELEGAMVKLSALAEINRSPVTLALARQGLADQLAQAQSAVTMTDIESAVAAFFGVTPADIHSSSRMHTVSLARMTAMFLARRRTRMSFPEIGRFCGKNHSTVVLAVQKMERMLQAGQTCRWMSPAGVKEMPLASVLDLLSEQLA